MDKRYLPALLIGLAAVGLMLWQSKASADEGDGAALPGGSSAPPSASTMGGSSLLDALGLMASPAAAPAPAPYTWPAAPPPAAVAVADPSPAPAPSAQWLVVGNSDLHGAGA